MPKPIPFPVKKKEAPGEAPGFVETPEETKLTAQEPDVTPQLQGKPEESKLKEEIPDVSPQKEEVPDSVPPKEEMPSNLNMENVVEIGGKQIEIKPTKLKYFRNKTTSSYGYLKTVPLNDFLAIPAIKMDEGKAKDPDQLLYNFLVAALDDAEFVRDYYDEMTADDVDRIVKIFGRINHIDEKEEATRKNKEAQAANH